MPLHRLAAAGAAAAALLAPAATARADLVRLIDGRTIEGKVTRSGNRVIVKGWKGKSAAYAASEVKFTEAGECSWDVAGAMLRAIPADASDVLFVEGHLEVARYLRERSRYTPELVEMENKEYEAILRRSPGNEEAHSGLGHVRWGTWWFKNDAERDKFRKNAPPGQMEPLGYRKYKKTGTWEMAEDVKAMEEGKIRFRGKWMSPDEKKIAEGYVKDEKGGWVLAKDVLDRERLRAVEEALKEKPVTVTSSRHFRFISWFPVAETAGLKEQAENTFVEHRRLLGVPVPKEEEGEDGLFTEIIEVFLLIEGDRKDRWVEAYGKDMGWNDEIIQHRLGDGVQGWHFSGSPPHMVCNGAKALKNRQRDAEGDLEFAKASVSSMIGRMILDRLRPQQLPWLTEGNAILAEIRMNETANICYSSKTDYREEVANKQGSKAKYFEFMKTQIGAGLSRSLRQIFSLELNDLDWADSVKAWSFLEFLVARHQTGFQELLRTAMLPVEEITPAQIEAAVLGRKKKDPAAEPVAGPKAEEPIPTAPVKVQGPDAKQVTPGSREERAIRAAVAEAWICAALRKDLETVEKEYEEWIAVHPRRRRRPPEAAPESRRYFSVSFSSDSTTFLTMPSGSGPPSWMYFR